MDKQKVVWLIEDDPEQADQFARLLQRASDGDLVVEFVPVRPQLTDYVDLLTDERTGAVILDQRLSEQSGVSYQGIELAEFLRVLRPELPIFILTQHADDDLLHQKEESVEFVIDKEDLTSLNHVPKVHVARILRAMGYYEEALNAKQRRLKELIDRKLSEQLDEAELAELEALRADIERPTEAQMNRQEAAWEAKLQTQDEFLEQLKQITQNIRQLVKQ